ncbi:MAG: DUF2079 domain-containing protein [Thermoleophilia bacterium]|nr:DUF2079 domain-containing protein [Thermoleophilia bacterium]
MSVRDLPWGIPRVRPPDPRRDPATLAAALLMVAAAVGMSWLAIHRYDNFWAGRFDLGNMVQAIWSTTQGRPLESTDTHGEQFVRLGAHVDPILVLFAPLWAVFPHPQMLLIVQSTAVALGGWPVFWLARRWIGSDAIALGAVAAYLLYPPLLWSQISEFHPVVLAVPLLLYAIWAIEEDRPAVCAVCVVLALATKEHVGLGVVFLGVWCAVAHGRRRWGAALAVGGLAWTAACMTIIIPRFAPADGENPFAGRYAHLGGSLTDVPKALLTDPGLVARTVFTEPKMLYLVALLAPLAFLPLGSPLLALGAVPEIAMNVLTNYWPQYSVQFQYTAVATPFLVAAAVRTLGRVLDSPRLPREAGRPAAWAGLLVVAALAGGWRLGPLPVWYGVPGGSTDRRWELESTPHAAAMAEGVALIPRGVPVSAGNPFGARLSDRRRIFSYPVVGSARWVIIDMRRPYLADIMVSPAQFAPHALAMRTDPRFRQVFDRDGVMVFRRVAPSPRVPS